MPLIRRATSFDTRTSSGHPARRSASPAERRLAVSWMPLGEGDIGVAMREALHDGLAWFVDDEFEVQKLGTFLDDLKGWWDDEVVHHDDPDYYPNLERAVLRGETPRIVIVENEQGDPVEILDGWHRVAVAVRNGISALPAYIGVDPTA